MNVKSLVGIILILIVLAVGGYYLAKPKESGVPLNLNTNQSQNNEDTSLDTNTGASSQMPAPNNESNVSEAVAEEEEEQPASQPATHNVSMNGDSFNPTTLQIKVGDTVTFTNTGSALVWPASNPHPSHTGLSGFDAQRPLEPGESWSFKFTRAGSFGYHDHLNPSVRGTIVVE